MQPLVVRCARKTNARNDSSRILAYEWALIVSQYKPQRSRF
jgi:hypothetical protein